MPKSELYMSNLNFKSIYIYLMYFFIFFQLQKEGSELQDEARLGMDALYSIFYPEEKFPGRLDRKICCEA